MKMIIDLIKDMISAVIAPIVVMYFTKKKNDGKLFFTIETIGDRCIELSYLFSYRMRHKDHKVYILTKDVSSPLYKYFPYSYDELIQISSQIYGILMHYFGMQRITDRENKESPIICLHYQKLVKKWVLENNDNITISDITKAALKLPSRTKPCGLFLDMKNDVLIQKYQMIQEKHQHRVVLLNPSSASYQFAPYILFEILAAKLMENNFYVLTNVIGSEKPIEKTEEARFPLDHFAEIIDRIDYVIGARSGFMDLACFTKTHVIAIDSKEVGISRAYLVENLWPESKCKTFSLDINSDLHDFSNSIVDYILINSHKVNKMEDITGE